MAATMSHTQSLCARTIGIPPSFDQGSMELRYFIGLHRREIAAFAGSANSLTQLAARSGATASLSVPTGPCVDLLRCIARLGLRAGLVQLRAKPIQRCPNYAIAAHRFAPGSGCALVVVVRVERHERSRDRLADLRDSLAFERLAQTGDGATFAAACEQFRGDGAHPGVVVSEVLQRQVERLVLVAVLEDRECIHARYRSPLARAREHCAELVDALRLQGGLRAVTLGVPSGSTRLLTLGVSRRRQTSRGVHGRSRELAMDRPVRVP